MFETNNYICSMQTKTNTNEMENLKVGQKVEYTNNGFFNGVIIDIRPSQNMKGESSLDYLIRDNSYSISYPFGQEWRGACQITNLLK